MDKTIGVHLDSRQATPLYEQIVHAVRDRIARGDLAPGAALPTVRDLARELGVNQNTVSRAYGVLRREGLLEGHVSQGTRVAAVEHDENLRPARDAELRLLVTRFIGESLSRGFSLADLEAAFVGQRARWQLAVHPAARETEARPDQVLGIGSHDLCLELLIAQFHEAHPERRIHMAVVGSLAGLMTLARGEAHFAAAHLYDAASDDYNLPFVRRLLPDQPCALVTLAHRTQGLMVARGNPLQLRTLRDVARKRARFVNRQRGSGTRSLLDERLRQERVAPRRVQGYAREEMTHVSVAAAIASGSADVGLGIQAAARSFDLDFVPLTQERFELILRRDEPLLPLLLGVIARSEFREAVVALGGYDVRETGKVRLS